MNKGRNRSHRAMALLHAKLKDKNRRFLNIIKHERNEKAVLLERIRKYKEASVRAEREVNSLKSRLAAVRAALAHTSTIIEDGLAKYHLAKLSLQEMSEEINQDLSKPGPTEQGEVACNEQSSSGTQKILALVPPPKLQARVNPMVQGVPLMSPSIMLLRLQPDELEQQLSSTQQAVSATTPIGLAVPEASVPTSTDAGRTSPHNELLSSEEPHATSSAVGGVDLGTEIGLGNDSAPRRSTRLRRL